MSELLQLDLPENWVEVWDYTEEAHQLYRNSYDPIPDIKCPHVFNYHVIALSVTAVNGKSYWNFGGFMNQQLDVGFTGKTGFAANVVNKQRIYLKRWQLFVFPKYTPSYTLTFEVPFWFKGISLLVMEYTGIHFSPLEVDVLTLKGMGDYNRETLEQVQLNTEELLER